jgi:large subunit ribosomal protein L18
MSITTSKVAQRTRRHARIRTQIIGTETRPRLAVFRSNRFIYAQLINDEAGKTIASADSRTAKGAKPLDRAKEVGTLIAGKAKEKGITTIVFDRGGFQYQGMIASLADGAREAGLSF